MLASLVVNRTGGDNGRTVRASEFMDAAAVEDTDEELTPEVFMRIVQKGK